jgi:hypothetical protein
MSDLSDFRLTPRERRLVRSLVPVACPAEAEALGVVDDTVEEVELGIRSLPPLVQTMLRAGMLGYDLAAVALYRRRAHKLTGERARAYFAMWRSGTALQRNFIKGIKGIIGMAYYEQPAVTAAIDYTPQAWIDKVKERRLRVYKDDIAAFEPTLFERDPVPLPSEVLAREGGAVSERAKRVSELSEARRARGSTPAHGGRSKVGGHSPGKVPP